MFLSYIICCVELLVRLDSGDVKCQWRSMSTWMWWSSKTSFLCWWNQHFGFCPWWYFLKRTVASACLCSKDLIKTIIYEHYPLLTIEDIGMWTWFNVWYNLSRICLRWRLPDACFYKSTTVSLEFNSVERFWRNQTNRNTTPSPSNAAASVWTTSGTVSLLPSASISTSVDVAISQCRLTTSLLSQFQSHIDICTDVIFHWFTKRSKKWFESKHLIVSFCSTMLCYSFSTINTWSEATSTSQDGQWASGKPHKKTLKWYHSSKLL